MNVLLGALLALPLLGGLAVLVRRSRRLLVAQVVGATAALGWVVLLVATSGSDPARVALGRLEVDPLTAAAVAGAAVLAGARPPASALGVSTALTGVTVLAAAATVTENHPPDRPFAAGVVVLTAMALLRCRAVGASRRALLALAAGGVAVTVGLALGDAERAAVLVLVGAATVAVVVVPAGLPALQLLPVALLAAQRTVTTPRAAVDAVGGPLDPVIVTGVGTAVLAAGALLLLRGRPVLARSSTGVAVSALVLFATDLPELQRSGLLLAAGAVLAVAASHPAALLAVLPGLVAGVDAAGVATEPEHAAAGLGVLVLLGAASIRSDTDETAPAVRWWLLPALVFGLVPTWGWAGVDLPAYTEAVAVAGAVGFAVLAAIAAAPTVAAARRKPEPEPEPELVEEADAPERAIRPRGVRIVARRSVPAEPPDGIPHTDE